MRTYCFVDASNLFYGGVKRMGWSVDYKKLKDYLIRKYEVQKIFYYAGIETDGFEFKHESTVMFPIRKLIKFLENKLEFQASEKSALLNHIAKAKFYLKLASFGYDLKLKPVKYMHDYKGIVKKKANCDVDLTFDAMRLRDEFDRLILLSGDGDFEIMLKYFKEQGKEIYIMSNPQNTATSIKRNFSKEYRNFAEIRQAIEF
jgi:uncharacterized LabA/DUF88 family protein